MTLPVENETFPVENVTFPVVRPPKRAYDYLLINLILCICLCSSSVHLSSTHLVMV